MDLPSGRSLPGVLTGAGSDTHLPAFGAVRLQEPWSCGHPGPWAPALASPPCPAASPSSPQPAACGLGQSPPSAEGEGGAGEGAAGLPLPTAPPTPGSLHRGSHPVLLPCWGPWEPACPEVNLGVRGDGGSAHTLGVSQTESMNQHLQNHLWDPHLLLSSSKDPPEPHPGPLSGTTSHLHVVSPVSPSRSHPTPGAWMLLHPGLPDITLTGSCSRNHTPWPHPPHPAWNETPPPLAWEPLFPGLLDKRSTPTEVCSRPLLTDGFPMCPVGGWWGRHPCGLTHSFICGFLHWMLPSTMEWTLSRQATDLPVSITMLGTRPPQEPALPQQGCAPRSSLRGKGTPGFGEPGAWTVPWLPEQRALGSSERSTPLPGPGFFSGFVLLLLWELPIGKYCVAWAAGRPGQAAGGLWADRRRVPLPARVRLSHPSVWPTLPSLSLLRPHPAWGCLECGLPRGAQLTDLVPT